MKQRYKIADIIFEAEYVYALSRHLLAKYEYKGEKSPELFISITESDLSNQAKVMQDTPLALVENTLIFKQFCNYLLESANGLIFHSSAVAVDGNAYLFTAPSGTGKSTHAKIWQDIFGDGLTVVNDDKPIIRLLEDGFYVYGSPWNGKRRLDTDCKVKIKAIAHLMRGENNLIKKATLEEMLPVVLNQTLRPQNEQSLDKLLAIIEKLLTTTPCYKMHCNMQRQAGIMAYTTMSGREPCEN